MKNRATNKLDILQLHFIQSGGWIRRRQDEVTEMNRMPHIGSSSHGTYSGVRFIQIVRVGFQGRSWVTVSILRRALSMSAGQACTEAEQEQEKGLHRCESFASILAQEAGSTRLDP